MKLQKLEREEINPKPVSYKELVKQYIDDWDRFKQSMDKLF